MLRVHRAGHQQQLTTPQRKRCSRSYTHWGPRPVVRQWQCSKSLRHGHVRRQKWLQAGCACLLLRLLACLLRCRCMRRFQPKPNAIVCSCGMHVTACAPPITQVGLPRPVRLEPRLTMLLASAHPSAGTNSTSGSSSSGPLQGAAPGAIRSRARPRAQPLLATLQPPGLQQQLQQPMLSRQAPESPAQRERQHQQQGGLRHVGAGPRLPLRRGCYYVRLLVNDRPLGCSTPQRLREDFSLDVHEVFR